MRDSNYSKTHTLFPSRVSPRQGGQTRSWRPLERSRGVRSRRLVARRLFALFPLSQRKALGISPQKVGYAGEQHANAVHWSLHYSSTV